MLAAPRVTRRPLIGITERFDLQENTFYLRRSYADAVAAAGGAPVHLPLIDDQEALLAIAKQLDGLLLSGSNSDLDPIHYGEEPHRALGVVVPPRDATDLLLLNYAEQNRLPVLAICFGMQSLNVSRGGTLIQDIPTQVPKAFKHDQEQPYTRPSHTIMIERGSLLARLAESETARVNSSHHQSIKDVGRNLMIIARAKDDVIEAVEDVRADRFVLGVQWHPESGWEVNELSRQIFRSFIEAATK
jgi:putative glutamine amidotransferase